MSSTTPIPISTDDEYNEHQVTTLPRRVFGDITNTVLAERSRNLTRTPSPYSPRDIPGFILRSPPGLSPPGLSPSGFSRFGENIPRPDSPYPFRSIDSFIEGRNERSGHMTTMFPENISPFVRAASIPAHAPRIATPILLHGHVTNRTLRDAIADRASGFRLMVEENILFNMIRHICAHCNNAPSYCDYTFESQYMLWIRSLNAANPRAFVDDRLVPFLNDPLNSNEATRHGTVLPEPRIEFVGEPVNSAEMLLQMETIRLAEGFHGLMCHEFRMLMLTQRCGECNQDALQCQVLRTKQFDLFMAEARILNPMTRRRHQHWITPTRPAPAFQPLAPASLIVPRRAQNLASNSLLLAIGECKVCFASNEDTPEPGAVRQELMFYHCSNCQDKPVCCEECAKEIMRHNARCPQCRAPLALEGAREDPIRRVLNNAFIDHPIEDPALGPNQHELILNQLADMDDPLIGFNGIDNDADHMDTEDLD